MTYRLGSSYLRDGNKIGIVLDITYEEVIPGTAWFFKKATLQVLRSRPSTITGLGGVETGTLVETLGNVLVNRPIPADAFVVRLPEGTRVFDAVSRSQK